MPIVIPIPVVTLPFIFVGALLFVAYVFVKAVRNRDHDTLKSFYRDMKRIAIFVGVVAGAVSLLLATRG
jgi:Trk-type K+ transport system membrane component